MTPEILADSNPPRRLPLRLAGSQGDSISVSNAIARYIFEYGYGYPVELASLPSTKGLKPWFGTRSIS